MGCGASDTSMDGVKRNVGMEFSQKYTLTDDHLGAGCYGTVYRCTDSAGANYAAKTVIKGKHGHAEMEAVKEEAKITQWIDHPNCVKLHDFYESKKMFTLVLELVEGGELFARIYEMNFFSEKDAAKAIFTLGQALSYLHSNGIVHRDLKPENLLYDSDRDDAELKLSDFGLAKKISVGASTLETRCGSPSYVAPEILFGDSYGAPVYLWSTGVILYILLSGTPPFYAETMDELYSQIKSADYDFPEDCFEGVSEAAKNVVRKLLTVDPKSRMTADELIKDDWVVGKTAAATEISQDTRKRMAMVNAKVHLRQVCHCLLAVERINKIISLDDSAESYLDAVKALGHNVHYLNTEAATQELNEAFSILDRDQVGELDSKCIAQTLNALGHNITEATVLEKFIKRVDSNSDGFISFEEFEFIMKKNKSEESHEAELKEVFDRLDGDGDGGVTAAELSAVLDNLNQHEEIHTVKVMVESVDDDNDGEISFKEFVNLMNEHHHVKA